MTSSDNNEIWKPEEYAAYHKMVFRVIFNFLNSHFPPRSDPEWWKNLAQDMDKASDEAKGGVLVNGMLTVIGDYLEKEWEKRRA